MEVTRMQQRRGTSAQWISANPVLADGEIGVEKDSGRFKIGDGVLEWTALAYASVKAIDLDTAINNLVGSAPNLLNTLGELSDALGDDQNFAAAVTANLTSLDERLDSLTEFNPMDYGAVGDGISDDSIAFRAVRDAAYVARPSVIKLPPGKKFRLSSYDDTPIAAEAYTFLPAVSLKSGIHWVGGKGATIISPFNDVSHEVAFGVDHGVSDWSVSGVRFETDSPASSLAPHAAFGIYGGVKRWSIENCFFTGWRGHCIFVFGKRPHPLSDLDQPQWFRISDNVFHDNAQHYISLNGPRDFVVTDNIGNARTVLAAAESIAIDSNPRRGMVTNNRVVGTIGIAGEDVTHAAQILISGNVIDVQGGAGGAALGIAGSDIIVSNNIVDTKTLYDGGSEKAVGIRIEAPGGIPASRLSIIGNTIRRVNTGIEAVPGTPIAGLLISRNTISGGVHAVSATPDIKIAHSDITECVVSNNICTSPLTSISSRVPKVLISGNYCKGPIDVFGSRSMITGNMILSSGSIDVNGGAGSVGLYTAENAAESLIIGNFIQGYEAIRNENVTYITYSNNIIEVVGGTGSRWFKWFGTPTGVVLKDNDYTGSGGTFDPPAAVSVLGVDRSDQHYMIPKLRVSNIVETGGVAVGPVKKMEVFDSNGASAGFIAVYTSIT